MPEVSIIIRTKNEERWIAHCLGMICKQVYQDFEIILVDNESTDYTVQVAKRFPLAAIIKIKQYLPGFAINEGIRASSGRYIVCISAHCIPKDCLWLSNLIKNIDDEKIAGVYGRQVPVAFTSDVDKRDLLTTFGLDRRIQIKDYFFHNANSIIQKDIWELFPFDENATNIEDRLWGKAVIEAGYQIIYEPDAVVYHHHGLHQGNKPERAKGVVSIIEQVDSASMNGLPESLRPDNVNIIAVVPVKGAIDPNSIENQLINQVVAELKNAKYINEIYFLSDDNELSERHGLSWIPRYEIAGVDSFSIDELMKETLVMIEKRKIYPEALLYVNYEYIFRPHKLFDNIIVDAQYKGYDTVFPGLIDYGHYWVVNGMGEFIQTSASMKPRKDREPTYKALYGLGCFTSSSVLRTCNLVGGRIGILPIDDSRSALRIGQIGAENIFYTLMNEKKELV
ncbi:hypothetical protein JCM14469_19820 [Desulfatiferula olefinivorans]